MWRAGVSDLCLDCPTAGRKIQNMHLQYSRLQYLFCWMQECREGVDASPFVQHPQGGDMSLLRYSLGLTCDLGYPHAGDGCFLSWQHNAANSDLTDMIKRFARPRLVLLLMSLCLHPRAPINPGVEPSCENPPAARCSVLHSSLLLKKWLHQKLIVTD